MKNKITLLFLILGMLTLFFACQKDDTTSETVETEAAAPEGPYKISTIDQSNVQQNSKITTRLANLLCKHSKSTSDTQFREIYNEAYDFSIDTDNVTYIESTDGTYHSYTFEVFRSDATESLENLLLSLQEDGSYKAVLVSYDLTSQEKANLLIGISPDYEGKVTATALDDFDSDGIFNRTSPFCMTISYGCCSQGNHPNGLNPDGSLCPANTTCYTKYCTSTGGQGNPNDPMPGGTGASGNTGNTNVTGTTYSEQPLVGVFECLPSLNVVDNVSIRNWLISHKRQAGELLAYLKDTQDECIAENADFGFLAAETLKDGGQVDYLNKVILDPTFLNNQKVKCVYDKLKGLSSTIFNDIVNDYFDSAKKSQITFKIATTPNGEDAFTKGRTNNGISTFEILLDPAVVSNASTIEIALMIIHESIHAELLDRCVQLGIINAFDTNGNPNFTNTSNTYTTYETLFSLLVYQYKNYGGTNSQWNHDLFTVLNYRTKMAQNLVSIHPWLNDTNNDFLTNVNSDNLNFYGNFTIGELMDYLTWVGLEGTQEFINTIQNVPLEQTKKNYVENAARTQYTNSCN